MVAKRYLDLLFLTIVSIIPIHTQKNTVTSETLRGRFDGIDGCKIFLEVFAETSSNFTSCAILNARPINMCQQCIDSYILLEASFDAILKKSDNGSRCSSHYLNLDRLEIVNSIYGYSRDLWTRASCNNCFVFVNGQLTAETTNETREFTDSYNTVTNCINSQLKNTTEFKTVCEACMTPYLYLNDIYKGLSVKEIDICMDIVDAMNKSRQMWSEKLGCCKLRQHSEVLFLCLSTLMILMTVSFYFITKFSTTSVAPVIIIEKRFAESVHVPNVNRHQLLRDYQ